MKDLLISARHTIDALEITQREFAEAVQVAGSSSPEARHAHGNLHAARFFAAFILAEFDRIGTGSTEERNARIALRIALAQEPGCCDAEQGAAR